MCKLYSLKAENFMQGLFLWFLLVKKEKDSLISLQFTVYNIQAVGYRCVGLRVQEILKISLRAKSLKTKVMKSL